MSKHAPAPYRDALVHAIVEAIEQVNESGASWLRTQLTRVSPTNVGTAFALVARKIGETPVALDIPDAPPPQGGWDSALTARLALLVHVTSHEPTDVRHRLVRDLFYKGDTPERCAVLRALSLLGAPYKWGGAGPKTFDCSGLVQYVHEQIGIIAPRTAAEQYVAAKPVALNTLAPGDLLFFAIKGSRISHVAIYAGEGRFVHAPQTGRPVELRMLDDDFYRPRLVGAGRLF